WRHRGIGSRSILLILIWEYAISCSLCFPLYRIQYLFSSKQSKFDSISLWLMQEKSLVSIAVLSTILLPVVSLLAQVVIGRYKLISYSLKTLWLFSVIASLISICEDKLPVAKTNTICNTTANRIDTNFLAFWGICGQCSSTGNGPDYRWNICQHFCLHTLDRSCMIALICKQAKSA
ncbi:hypothetical protein GBAR_LOCUS1308, partial [Geodia barretti]